MKGNVISLSTMKSIHSGEILPLGTIVSYEDMANPRQTAIVISEEPEHYGQPVIFTEDFHRSTVTRSIIEGPGGWRIEEGIATTEEIEELKKKQEYLMKVFVKELLQDKLITDAADFEFLFKDGKLLYINGKKQPKAVFNKYKKLYEKITGKKLDDNKEFRIVNKK